MLAWWTSRSRREQGLLALMGLLAAGLAVWFLLLAPLAAAAEAARGRLFQARADEAVVGALAADIAALAQASAPPARTTALDEAVQTTALAAGLDVSRLEQGEAGLQALVTGPAQALAPWLLALQTEQGIQVVHLTLLKDEAGRVQADLTLAEAPR